MLRSCGTEEDGGEVEDVVHEMAVEVCVDERRQDGIARLLGMVRQGGRHFKVVPGRGGGGGSVYIVGSCVYLSAPPSAPQSMTISSHVLNNKAGGYLHIAGAGIGAGCVDVVLYRCCVVSSEALQVASQNPPLYTPSFTFTQAKEGMRPITGL